MTDTERLYVEKLKELIEWYIHFCKPKELEVKDCQKYRSLQSEIFSLEQQIEQEEKTISDDFCDLCGKQMVPRKKECIELICMNPKCDAYIKV